MSKHQISFTKHILNDLQDNLFFEKVWSQTQTQICIQHVWNWEIHTLLSLGRYVGSRPIKLRKSSWKDRNLEVVRKKQKEKKKLGLR